MKLFEKHELRILWPFYLDSLLSPMLFFAPAFWIVYFADFGFSMLQIGTLIAAAPLFSLIFEIPTGAIADLYGRKVSVLLGFFLAAISFIFLYFSNSFYTLLFSFAFLGFASTLPSGAKEAWVTDLIKKRNKNLLHTYFSKSQMIDSFALIISGFLGAFLVSKFGLSIIWIAGAISFMLAISALSFAKEEYFSKKAKLADSFKNLKYQTKKSLNYAYKHHVLFFFISAGIIAVFVQGFQSDLSWIPIMKELGLKDYQFGYMWSALALITMISPLFSLRFCKKNKERNFIIFSSIFVFIFSLFIFFSINLFLAFFILLGGAFFGYLKKPAEIVYFHRFIPSKLRATIGSINNMLVSLIAIIALPLAGFLVDLIGARYTIFLSGFLIIPAIIFYLKIKEEK